MATQPFDQPTLKAVSRLKSLKSQLSENKLKARIEFAIIVFKFDLYEELRTHLLFDDYNLSDRDLDNCFEMNDKDEVIHAVMKEVQLNSAMESNILAMGGSVWAQWQRIYSDKESQQDLFA